MGLPFTGTPNFFGVEQLMVSFFRSALKVSGTISASVSTIVLVGSLFCTDAARANGADSLKDIGGEASSDPFSSRGDNTSGIMQMIHRVMQGDGNIDRAELRAAQKENVNEATSDFFTKQRERLKATGANPQGLPVPTAGPGILPGPSNVNGLTPSASTAAPLLITAPIVTPAAPVESPAPQTPAK